MYEVLLLFLIAFTPLAHGAVEVWSITIVHTGSIVMVAWWLISMTYKGHIKIIRTPLDIPVLIFLFLACFSVYLSVYPYASRIELYKIINYTLIFYIVVNTMRNKKKLLRLTWGIALFGGIFALAALITTGERFLVFRTFSVNNYLSFTFRNHNHFAGYMEMISMICIGLAIASKGLRRILFLCLGIITSVAIIFSLSRGGMLGLTGGLIFFFLAVAFCKGRRKVILIGMSFTLLILVGLFLFADPEPFLNRLETLETPMETGVGRLNLWKDTLNMIAEKPWFGTGIGTFIYAYPRYQSLSAGAGRHIIKHAHNDYLELAVETGVTGLLTALLCIAIFFVVSVKKLLVQPEKHVQAIGLGALSGCFALLVHGLTDFNFQIPSNAVLFFMSSAIVTVCAKSDNNGCMSFWIDIKPSTRMKLSMYVLMFITSIGSFPVIISPYLGNLYFQKAEKFQEYKNYDFAYKAFKDAAFVDPGNAELFAATGDMLVVKSADIENKAEKETVLTQALKYYNDAIEMCPERSFYYSKKAYVLQRLGRFNEGEKTLKKSVYFEPNNFEKLDVLAQFYLQQGELIKAIDEYKTSMQILSNGEHLIKILDKMWEVTQNYNEVKKIVPEDASMRSVFGKYLLEKGKKIEAVEELAYAVTLEPTASRAADHLLGLEMRKDYKKALDVGETYLMKFTNDHYLLSIMGRIYRKTGNFDRAITVYEQLLNMKASYSYYVHPLAILYMQKERYSDAVNIIQTGLEFSPDNSELYYLLGSIYRTMSTNKEAIEALKKAVALRPDNETYRFHLLLAYKYAGLYYEAYKEAKRCLEINPGNKSCMREINNLKKSIIK